MRWRRQLGGQAGTLGWWVAWLFIIGSSLFALGSFPPYSQGVDPRAVGITFFVGSLFFTSAGGCQLVQTVREHQEARLVWAGAVQSVGTVFFNVNTFRAMGDAFDAQDVNRLIWAPDFFGSIAFLVASHLAWIVVCRRLWAVLPDDPDWWAAGLNYLGSVFFMASALASFTLTTTGDELNTTITNAGTFFGAVCFLVGAYVLLPAGEREEVTPG